MQKEQIDVPKEGKVEEISLPVDFLQDIVNYLQTKPYVEVHTFIDFLVKHNKG